MIRGRICNTKRKHVGYVSSIFGLFIRIECKNMDSGIYVSLRLLLLMNLLFTVTKETKSRVELIQPYYESKVNIYRSGTEMALPTITFFL